MAAQTDNHVVLLVHGIRDFALWQSIMRSALEAEGFKVEATNYGRLSLVEFLVPFASFFRKRAAAKICNQIRIVKQNNPNAHIFVIAHSFGTYVVAQIMQNEFDIKFHKVIFCGSVVAYHFPFEQLQSRFDQPIINEVGTKDIWPAIAESLTTGYGSAGTYGFRRPLVRDRWHAGARHGYFLNAEFCNRYWVPVLRGSLAAAGTETPERPARWLQVLSIVKIKYIVILILLSLIVRVTWNFRIENPTEYISPSREEARTSATRNPIPITDIEMRAMREIDEWIGVLDEQDLRKAFDIPGVLDHTLEFISKNNGPWDGETPIFEKALIPDLSKLIDLSGPPSVGIKTKVKIPPGTVAILFTTKAYEDAKSRLSQYALSAYLSDSLRSALTALDNRINSNMSLMVEVLDDEYKINPRLLLDYKKETSPYFAGASNAYWREFQPLRPAVEKVSNAIRARLTGPHG